MTPIVSFVIALSSAVAAAGVLWMVRHVSNSIDAFLARVEESDERSRDNYRVLADHDLIEESNIRHFERERKRLWQNGEEDTNR